MSKHTPGPWTTKRGDHGGYSVESNGRLTYPASKAICTVRPYPRTAEAHGEAEATARLIAAAPDLLKALLTIAKIASEGRESDIDIESIARAAIAKAEDRS
jgi:hypothetical protein